MWPVSAKFLAAIEGSYDVATKVEVLQGGEVIKTLTSMIGGRVDVARQVVRRKCSVTFVDLGEADEDGALTPVEADDLLAPYGNELRIWKGIDFQDGTDPELIPLGTFRIEKVIGDYPTVTVEGYDRLYVVSLARFETAYQILPGLVYTDQIRALLEDRLPAWVPINLPSVDDTTPMLVFDQEGDPADEAVKMATSLGFQLYADPLGEIQMRPEPDVALAPVVANYTETPDGDGLIAAKRTLDGELAKNVWVATGESTSLTAAVRGVAIDDDPLSPTYAGTPDNPSAFGRRPGFHSSPLYTTSDQCGRGADTLLQRSKGIGAQVDYVGLGNPAHEAGDVAYISRPAAGIEARHVLDSFPVDLGAEGSAFSYQTRVVQEVLGG